MEVEKDEFMGKEAFLKYFLRFRNNHGEVIVCVRVENKNDAILPAGFAFCNPLDFKHQRENRVRAGHGIAARRAERAPDVPGSYTIQLRCAVVNIDRRKLFGEIRERVVEILRRKSPSDFFGFHYKGKLPGEFEKWVVPFCEELQ